MPSFRKVLFQVHLWVGLAAGVFFILLGLSGSLLVYPELFTSSPPAPKATASGTPLSLEAVVAAARKDMPQAGTGSATITLPRVAGNPITIQFSSTAGGRGARGVGNFRGSQPAARDEAARRPGPAGVSAQRIYVDPVSGDILGHASAAPRNSPVGLARQLHESMLMGAAGRTLVAWLGVGMLFLGLSGLYLWWPKKGQWKFAFGVRRTARGFRLYREIHGAIGIWFWLVFLVVTATSIPLGFPGVMSMLTASSPRNERVAFVQPQIVDVPDNVVRLPLRQLVAGAEKAAGAKATGLVVPSQPNRPVSVTFANGNGPPRSIALNPYTGQSFTPAASPIVNPGITRRAIEQLHGGEGMGPVWRFLVFLSGFLPLIFVVTGLLMWIKKRTARIVQPKPAFSGAS
ncbi:MAG TPA: PepSY-associated TM helix domain-containing protein [Rhizomicrobium sp.]|nr:PepSY-associated TM helix domain-containing protein [Rhizomicrobium sp.]